MSTLFVQSTETVSPEELRNQLDALIVEIQIVTHPAVINWSNCDEDYGPVTVLLAATETMLKSCGVTTDDLPSGAAVALEVGTGNPWVEEVMEQVKGWSTEDLVGLNLKARAAWVACQQLGLCSIDPSGGVDPWADAPADLAWFDSLPEQTQHELFEKKRDDIREMCGVADGSPLTEAGERLSYKFSEIVPGLSVSLNEWSLDRDKKANVTVTVPLDVKNFEALVGFAGLEAPRSLHSALMDVQKAAKEEEDLRWDDRLTVSSSSGVVNGYRYEEELQKALKVFAEEVSKFFLDYLGKCDVFFESDEFLLEQFKEALDRGRFDLSDFD